jgi:hypothetical protein
MPLEDFVYEQFIAAPQSDHIVQSNDARQGNVVILEDAPP